MRRNSYRKGLMVLILVVFGLGTACSTIYEFADPYPSDDKLIETLSSGRQSFYALIALFEDDANLWYIDAKGNARSKDLNSAHLPEDRKRQYLELMKKTGVEHISRYPSPSDDTSISFQMWSVPNGPLMGAKSKHLVYKDEGLRNPVESLDVIYAQGGDAGHSRRIDSDWSLFLDVW